MKLQDLELDIAKEVLNVGLGKAADSIAFFTHDKVVIRSLDLQIKEPHKVIYDISNKREDESLYVLSTELLGEMRGVCYLIFSEEEVNKLWQVCLPESIRNNPEALKEMGEAVLLEMDNIIVASVVTQFSNFFKYKMYGDVPSLSKTISKGLEQIISSANRCSNYCLFFKSEFITSNLQINPEFVWLIDEKYFEGVKTLAQDDDAISQLLNKNA